MASLDEDIWYGILSLLSPIEITQLRCVCQTIHLAGNRLIELALTTSKSKYITKQMEELHTLPANGYNQNILEWFGRSHGKYRGNFKILPVRQKNIGDLKPLMDGSIAITYEKGDTSIAIYSSRSGELIRSLSGHMKQITRFIQLEDETIISASYRDKTIRIWKSDGTDRVISYKKEVDHMMDAKNGKAVICSPDAHLYSVLDIRTGALVTTTLHKDESYIIDFCAVQHNYFIIAKLEFISHMILEFWNITTGECDHSMPLNYEIRQLEIQEESGKLVIVAAAGGRGMGIEVNIYDILSRTRELQIKPNNEFPSCLLLPNHKIALTEASQTNIWNTLTGSCDFSFPAPIFGREVNFKDILRLGDGSRIGYFSNNDSEAHLIIYEVSTGVCIQDILTPCFDSWSILPDGRLVGERVDKGSPTIMS